MDLTVTNEVFCCLLWAVFGSTQSETLRLDTMWPMQHEKTDNENAQGKKENVHILWIRYYFVLALLLCEVYFLLIAFI